jgi:hypothetical protein
VVCVSTSLVTTHAVGLTFSDFKQDCSDSLVHRFPHTLGILCKILSYEAFQSPPPLLLCILRGGCSTSGTAHRLQPDFCGLNPTPSACFGLFKQVCLLKRSITRHVAVPGLPYLSSSVACVGPVIPGLTSPSTFPSRGFSPPQGFASYTASWPCFVPQPLMRFHSPSESSPCW